MSIHHSQLSLEVLDKLAVNNPMSNPLDSSPPIRKVKPRVLPAKMNRETLYPLLESDSSKTCESTLNTALVRTRRMAKDFSNNYLQRVELSKYYDHSRNSDKRPDAMKIGQQQLNKNMYLFRRIQAEDSTLIRQLFETASSTYAADLPCFQEKSCNMLEKSYPQIWDGVESVQNAQDASLERISVEIPAWIKCKVTIQQMVDEHEKTLRNYARWYLASTGLSSMARPPDFIEKLGVVESSTISIAQEDLKIVKEAMKIAQYGL